jgi:hypothetical protein
MVETDSKLVPYSSNKFVCEKCDFTCSRKSQYDRHLSTRKHMMDSKMIENDSSLVPNSSNEFKCECGKSYKWDSGYYRHKKKCNYEENIVIENKQSNNTVSTTDMNNPVLLEKMFAMFTQMMTQNQDFMTNVIGKVQGNNNNHTNSHNTNNQFNIQMFLNEVCRRLIETSHEETYSPPT